MQQVNSASLPHELVKQLRQCGHFLHYRMGGKAGKRRILAALLEHGEILQRDLQDVLGVQSGSLSEMIIKMEAEGLVEKLRSKQDGRNLVLRLTPEGIVRAKSSQLEYNAQLEEMMACFSEGQMRELSGLLETMTTHWKEIEKGWDPSGQGSK